MRQLRQTRFLHEPRFLNVMEFGEKHQRIHEHVYVDVNNGITDERLHAFIQEVWDLNRNHVGFIGPNQIFGKTHVTFHTATSAAAYAAKSIRTPNYPDWYMELFPNSQRFSHDRTGFWKDRSSRARKRSSTSSVTRRRPTQKKPSRDRQPRFKLFSETGKFLGTFTQDRIAEVLGRHVEHKDELSSEEYARLISAVTSPAKREPVDDGRAEMVEEARERVRGWFP